MTKKEMSKLNRTEMMQKLKSLNSQKTFLEHEIQELEQAKKEKFPLLNDRYLGSFYVAGDREIQKISRSNDGSCNTINCWTEERAKEVCKKMSFMFLLETLYDLFVITPKAEADEEYKKLTIEDASKFIIRFDPFHTNNPFYYNATSGNDVSPYEVLFPDGESAGRVVEYLNYLFSKHFVTYGNGEFNINFKHTYEVDFCKEDDE